MAKAPDLTSQPMTFDGSLSFLDDLMALEGIETAELPSMTSSTFAEAPGEVTSGRNTQPLNDLPTFPRQPEASFAALDTDPISFELPELSMEFGGLESLPAAEGPSQKERARATQKRFRSRQKVLAGSQCTHWLGLHAETAIRFAA